MLASVAFTSEQQLAQCVPQLQVLDTIKASARTWPFLVIGDSWDETRMKLQFGSMQGLLDLALSILERRQIFTEEQKAWIADKIRKSRWAVFEVFVREMRPIWSQNNSERVFVPVCVLENNKATTLHRACSTSFPQLSLEQVVGLKAFVKFIMLAWCLDRATGNKRYRKDRP